MHDDHIFEGITSEVQYEKVLARIYDLMQTDIKEGSAEGIELESLGIIAEKYEHLHYPIPKPR